MKFDELRDGLVRRRAFLIAPLAFAGLVAVSSRKAPDEPDTAGDVTLVEFGVNGNRTGSGTFPKLKKSTAEWKSQLTPDQFYVTRRKSTDTPYTGTYYELHAPGLFRCVCCGTALFSSKDKFDSGTGWPSFSAPLASENIRTVKDTSMLLERVEVLCRRCDAHLGHVFEDGPAPTGQRYCINESSLKLFKLPDAGASS